MKKHVSQMIKYEKELIGRIIRKLSSWELTPYCKSRLTGRNMTVGTIQDVIKNGEMIEFHRKEDTNRNRVLLRGKKPTRDRDVACVVVDLGKGTVVTAYWNTGNDHHDTLDWSAYDAELDVIHYLKGELG